MMLPTEYDLHEYRKNLLQQVEQARLARLAQAPTLSLTQRAGHSLLKFGAKLAADQQTECTTIQTGDQVVTVCPA